MSTLPNPFEAGSSASGLGLPLMTIDARVGRLKWSARSVPGQPRQWLMLSTGIRLVLDYGVRYFGLISFEPTVKEIPVLDGEAAPQLPEGDGRKWQPFIAIPTLVEGLGLLKFSITSDINQRRIATHLDLWKSASEAQRGMLQECILHPFGKVSTQNGEFFGIVLEPANWIDRNEPPFSRRLIPPPSRLAMPVAPTRLPSGAGGAAAPVPPKPAEAAAIPPPEVTPKPVEVTAIPPSKPAEAATLPPPPDPLARYRPAGAGLRPF